MRILQAHNRHTARGGADQVLEDEGSLLVSAGHTVEQYFLEPAGPGRMTTMRRSVDAIWNVSATRELERRIKDFRPDVVHVHTPFPLLSPAVFRTITRMCPAVTTVHSYRYSCIVGTCLRDGSPCEDCVGKTLKLPGIRHRCYHSSFGASTALTLSLATHRTIGTFERHVARFITLTDFAAELLVRDGIPAEHVVVKPNSVQDPGPPKPREDGPSFALYAGRLVEEKGIRTLLAAWRVVGSELPLKIAGDGPLRQLVEEEARTNPAIDFLGWVEEDAMSELLAAADMLVFPSEWYEAQPLIILRAFATGTPVVCSDLENISAQVLKAEAGVAFQTRDSESLAKAVLKLTAAPDVLGQMRGNARAAYEAFHTPAKSLEGLERIYAAVVAERT